MSPRSAREAAASRNPAEWARRRRSNAVRPAAERCRPRRRCAGRRPHADMRRCLRAAVAVVIVVMVGKSLWHQNLISHLSRERRDQARRPPPARAGDALEPQCCSSTSRGRRINSPMSAAPRKSTCTRTWCCRPQYAPDRFHPRPRWAPPAQPVHAAATVVLGDPVGRRRRRSIDTLRPATARWHPAMSPSRSANILPRSILTPITWMPCWALRPSRPARRQTRRWPRRRTRKCSSSNPAIPMRQPRMTMLNHDADADRMRTKAA